MSKDPAFLFYANDWAGGTNYLTLEEKGAYIELLLLQFHKGRFTQNQARQLLGEPFERIWPELRDKFETEGSYYWNQRMADIREKRKAFTKSRRDNRLGKTKEKQVKNTSKTLEKQVGNGNGIVNRNENGNKGGVGGFDKFWDAYDKKRDRQRSEREWSKLSEDEKKAVMEYIPAYIESAPEKRYRKDPATFLYNKSWLNEIIHDDSNPDWFRNATANRRSDS